MADISKDSAGFNKKSSIYVLQLKTGKYYIGKSDNVQKRISSHVNYSDVNWVKENGGVDKVVKIQKECNSDEEDNCTINYMKKYGISNVRGGSFTGSKFDSTTIKDLNYLIYGNKEKISGETRQKMDDTRNNTCFRCGRKSHFIEDCYAKKDIDGNSLEYSEESYFSEESGFNEESGSYY